MIFPKGQSYCGKKRNWFQSPFIERNLVFRELQESIENSVSDMRRKLGQLEDLLTHTQDLKKRARIKGEIDQLEQKIKIFEGGHRSVPGFLLNGLQNNIETIEARLEKEMDISRRHQLEEQRDLCIEAITSRQAELGSADEYREACLQIESDDRILERIGRGYLDEVDLEILMRSDLMPFIDSYFLGQLEIAYNQMYTADRAQVQYSRQDSGRLELSADRAWISFEERAISEIGKLEEEKAEIEANPGRDMMERERQRRRIEKIERTIPFLRDQLNDEKEWKHRFRTETEISETGPVMGNIHNDAVLKLQQLFESAKALKLEQIHAYLEERFRKLETLLEEGFTGTAESQTDFIRTAKEELEKARGLYLNPDVTDPEELQRISNSLDDFEEVAQKEYMKLGGQEERMEDPEQKAAIIEDIRENYGKLQEALSDLKELPFETLKERIIQRFRQKHGLDEDSAIVRKQLSALKKLKEAEAEEKEGEVSLSKRIQEMEEEMAALETIPAEQLTRLESDLIILSQKLEILQREEGTESIIEEIGSNSHQQALLAQDILKDLEHAATNEDIREALEKNLGQEHLRFIDHNTFETEYRDVTEGGHMAMEEQGERWWIVVDESAFETETPEDLLKEAKHELLHVVFEKDDKIKETVRKAFIDDRPEEWKEIRQAYIDMAKERGEKAPDGTDWKDDGSHDDDILSELYAMQNEMGQFMTDGNTATDKLNNLLAGAGIGAAIGDIDEKSREFENDNVKRRGYQAGVERGEEGGEIRPGSGIENVSKEKAVYEKNNADIDGIRSRIKELKHSKYLQYVKGGGRLLNALNAYNDKTDSLNKELLSSPDSLVIAVTINQRIGEVASELNSVEDVVGKAARKAPNDQISIFRKMWLDTSFLSLDDVGQVAVDIWEFLDRRHKRKKADHAAQLGMALFKGTDLGREAYARQQKAEAEEVQEWQSRYENLDAWQLLAELKAIAASIDPSKDQLKAIMRILAQKGRIDWRDPNLWICLNRLQGDEELVPGDRVLLHNPVLLRQKLHKAMGAIWDYDEYSTLLRQNESSYESEKSKYNSEHDRSQDTLTAKMDDMLARKRNGESVDPMEYESIIEYCINNGKSFAEAVMFHLMAGMAEGILAPDRGLALGKHLNLWPTIDYFTSFQPPLSTDDFYDLCKREFPKSFKEGSLVGESQGGDFKNWFWRVCQNDQKVIERVQKSVGERSWDHDWGRSIACLGSAQTAKQFLAGRSGQQETKHTAVGNAYVGAVQWLEENAKNPEFATKEKFAKIAGWIAMAEGVLNGTAYNRKESDISTRQDAAMNSATPREASVGRYAGKSLSFHRDITKEYLIMIDPGFFSIILDPARREARSPEQKKALGTWAAQYLSGTYGELAGEMQGVEEIDQIYDRMDLIINTMFDNMSDARFKGILSNLAPSN